MTLDLIAAKVVVGVFNPKEVIDTSMDALGEVDSKSLVELAISTDLRREEIRILLLKSFSELQSKWPTLEEAVHRLVVFELQRITQSQINPRNGVRRLI